MLDSLAGKTAIVTGAASGIGRETAKQLAREEANVVGIDIQEDELKDNLTNIEKEYGTETLSMPVDITEEQNTKQAVQSAIDEFGEIDILANIAGITIPQGVEDMSTDTYNRQMSVNLDGTFFMTRASLPHIRDSSGNLIFIGSYAGRFPRPFAPVYSGTKWWIRGFAHSLSGRVADDDVAVTVINPSEVRTDIAEGLLKDRYDEGEIPEPSDVAEAVVFAAKQEPPNTVAELDLFRRNKFSDF
jgi:NADP-dependent 3-hydroxy acid dehydrogenase YdfG